MAHKQNKHLSAASRAKISQKLRADEAVKREARFERKLERIEERDNAKALREAEKELKHLEHERNKHGYTAAEKQAMGEATRRTEEADSREISARAENRYRHELETRTYRAPHRRNKH